MRLAIIAAIKELNDRRGSTATEIKKHVKTNRPDGELWKEATFKVALKELGEGTDIVKSGARYSLSLGPEASFTVEVRSMLPRHEKMADLWRNERLCDAEVVSSDGRSFSAHRLVLAANSDYMIALLAEDRFKDSSGCPIQLPDVSSRALEHILEWMYEGSCKITNMSEVIELLEAANRLQCQELLDQLELATCDKVVDSDTCLGMWDLADRLSLDGLTKRAKKFALHNIGCLAESDKFNELSLARLLELVRDDGLKVKREEDVHTLMMMWVKGQTKYLSDKSIEKLFSCVRYPLMDKEFISDHVLNEPLLMNNPVYFRTALRSFCDPGCSKKRVGWPLTWEDVKRGTKVRVIGDVEELERLCQEIAPGADAKVNWIGDEMKEVAGTCFKIDDINNERRGVESDTRSETMGHLWWVPFTALRFA